MAKLPQIGGRYVVRGEAPEFLCELYAAEGVREITEFGGWVAYLAAQG